LTQIKNNKIFHFNDLEISVHLDVYDPAEDSFLLLESILIRKSDKFLEIGTGCGLIALEAARQGALVICTDINPYAIKITQCNIQKNKHLLKGSIEVRKGSLFSVFKTPQAFDCIVFNPPYLPTNNTEHVDCWFDAATDGGSDGLCIIKQFLNQAKNYMHHNSEVFFVFSSLSPQKKLETLLHHYGYQYSIVKSQTFDDETLFVYRITM
jgi:release factor glutamine methyltransferase